MTIQDLKDQNLILLECISGSKAYGLDVPGSDTDIKGVFLLPKEHFYGLNYIPQVSDERNDTVYYELGRFIELLQKNNPNILELLATPADKVLICHPIMKAIKTEMFLSKRCKDTFAGYAFTQIKKARGLNKKIVNPVARERKTVLDFCYILFQQGAVHLSKWLEKQGASQSDCGLVNIANVKDVYGLYWQSGNPYAYKGVIKKATASSVALSSIPKGETPAAYLYFNQDGYASYCKEYREYWNWVDKRNENRYENNLEHGKNYDAKNMMHTFRLLDMAEEILRTGKVEVLRPNRDELLAVRRGQWNYEELLVQANEKMQAVERAYQQSQLPERPDIEGSTQLLVRLRTELYS
jgi:hypothetical protein